MELFYIEEYCQTESIALHYLNKYSCGFTQIKQAENLNLFKDGKNLCLFFEMGLL